MKKKFVRIVVAGCISVVTGVPAAHGQQRGSAPGSGGNSAAQSRGRVAAPQSDVVVPSTVVNADGTGEELGDAPPNPADLVKDDTPSGDEVLTELDSAGDSAVSFAATAPAGQFAWPITGNAPYDWMGGYYIDDVSWHRQVEQNLAVDLQGTEFVTQVFAARPGVVVWVSNTCEDRKSSCGPTGDGTTTLHPNARFGNNVIIRHDRVGEGPLYTVYAHLQKNSIKVALNQSVTENTQLGVIGHSGWTDGGHVHFSIGKCAGMGNDCTIWNGPIPGRVNSGFRGALTPWISGTRGSAFPGTYGTFANSATPVTPTPIKPTPVTPTYITPTYTVVNAATGVSIWTDPAFFVRSAGTVRNGHTFNIQCQRMNGFPIGPNFNRHWFFGRSSNGVTGWLNDRYLNTPIVANQTLANVRPC